MGVNRELLKLANWRAQGRTEKQAFVPPGGGDPMAGGAPPMDPMMGGGAPPMDPMMGGGAPPMDPMMGGAPPAPPEDVRSIIQEELANAGVSGNGAAAAGGPAGAKAKKFDPAELDTKLYNMEKLIVAMANALGVSLPPDALLGPPPEGTVPPEGAEGPAPAAPPGPEGPGSAIKPIDPIQPAMPEAPAEGGNLKVSSDVHAVPTVGEPIAASTVTASDILNKTAALAQMARSVNNRG